MSRHPQPLTEPTPHLLAALHRWRRQLAAELARHNPFDAQQADVVAQRFLDRLLFASFAQAQGVPPPRTIAATLKTWECDHRGPPLYTGLGGLFGELAAQWGGGLFATHPLADAAQLPDSTVLAEVVRELELFAQRSCFGSLPLSFLGGVYEQQLDRPELSSADDTESRGRASRPQTRHHRGVYYTPGYIVDAILERTLAPLLAGATPARVLALRIFDPACGAGVFLLAAFAYLIDWHLRYYAQNESAQAPPYRDAYRDADGVLRLRFAKRRQILRRCLHGRDLDPRAVELAQMSLLLRLRQGEASERQQSRGTKLGARFALPLLTVNLQCGDTLLPRAKEGRRFSVIIGNPPYIRAQSLTAAAPQAAAQYRARYATARSGSSDIYVVFIERCLQLLRRDGRLGFIIPSKWWQAAYGAPLRRLLAKGRHYAEIHDFADEQVFAAPTTYTCISVFTKTAAKALVYRRLSPLMLQRHGIGAAAPYWEHQLDGMRRGGEPFHPGVPAQLRPLFERLCAQGPQLGDPAICRRIFQGLKTGLDSVFVLEPQRTGGSPAGIQTARYFSPALCEWVELESALLQPLVKGRELRRFTALPPRKVILFPYEVNDGTAVLIPPERLRREFPAAWDYLERNRAALLRREHARWQGADYYKYARSQALDVMAAPKLLTADLVDRMAFSGDRGGRLYMLGGAAGGYGLLPARPELAEPLLALLNSTLLEWLLRPPGLSTPFRGGWFSCESRFIARLPIRLPPGAAELAELATLVQRLAAAYEKLYAEAAELPSDADLDAAARRPPARAGSPAVPLTPAISDLEEEIDDRVFTLYEVTAEERRLLAASLIKSRERSGPDSAEPEPPDRHG